MAARITFQFGILFLLSRSQSSLGHAPSLAETKPIDPIFEEGDTLLLNCTLTTHYNGIYNASDIYFRHHDIQNYTYPYVQALSNIKAQLRLPNIALNMSGKFRCRLPGIFLGPDSVQEVHVVKRILQPVLDGCIILNWEWMVCNWSPSRTEQDRESRQTLFYRHPGDADDNWKTCPQNTSEKCTWPAPQFRMGANYCVQINVTNGYLPEKLVASDVTCVFAEENIVKPNPPENLEPTYASDYDGHVTLNWNPPTSSYVYETPLRYELNIQNQWQDQINIVTNATSMRLSVVPATIYTVEISVRPSKLGFASEKVLKSFKTPPTVPCKNPRTQMNAFSLSKESRVVLLYWKPITERNSCGSNLSYEVRARQSHGNTNNADIWRSVSPVVQLDNGAEMMLNSEEDEVTIQSKNSVGVATHLPHTIIHLPPSALSRNSSLNYTLVVEGQGNSVIVQWFTTGPEKHVMGYSLFWCQRQSSTHYCKTPIQWQNLNRGESEYNLTFSENYLRFQVGLAVNFRSGFTTTVRSTGIMWADRMYSQTGKAEAPHIVDAFAPHMGSHGEIDINWTPAKCNNQECAYVQTFVIFYCLADHQNNCHGEHHSVSIDARKIPAYSLSNLEHGSNYRIWMTSVARTGSSNPSEPKFATTTKSWLSAASVVGIVVVGIVGVVFAIMGLYVIVRHLHKYRKKFTNIPVAVPPIHRVPIPSTSSEAPMLGTRFDFNRQVSTVSGDSGRCSLSPASQGTSPLLSELTNGYEHLDSSVAANFSASKDMNYEDDGESTHDGVLSYTIVSGDGPKGEPAVPDNFATADSSEPEDKKDEDGDESAHGCVLSYTIVHGDAPRGEPAVLDIFTVADSSGLKDKKDVDDGEGTHECVLAYTIVSNDIPNGEPSVTNNAVTMGDPTISSVVSTGEIIRHSQYILPEQMERLGMLTRNHPCSERSEVDYCTGFSFSNPSAAAADTSSNNAADIAYAKIDNLHQNLYVQINQLTSTDGVNEGSQDSKVHQLLYSNQAEVRYERSNLVHRATSDQLLETLSTDPALKNDLQIEEPTTHSENNEPGLPLPPPTPTPGENGAQFGGYTKSENTDYPYLSCDDLEWRTGRADSPKQSPSSNWGYVDHAVFGFDSVV